jgi:methylated-DNA-[protein]-cysteine S-methyltransferase
LSLLDLASELLDIESGPLFLVASRDGMAALRFAGGTPADALRQLVTTELEQPISDQPSPLTRKAARQVREYLRGQRKVFTVPLDVRGTPFQRRVWDALRTIPYGETLSYGDLADSIGRPGSARAVANACGHNALPIFIPCHRVIASNGGLGGFSAGVAHKRRLLSIERATAASLPLFSIARAREIEEEESQRHKEVLDHLPPHLKAWLTATMEGRRPPEPWRGEEWVALVLESLEPTQLPHLAEGLAAHITSTGHTELTDFAEELVAASVSLLTDEPIAPENLRALLRASAMVAPRWLDVLCHRLLAHGGLDPNLQKTTAGVLQDIMAGTLPCSKRVRYRAIDLWSRLEPHTMHPSWHITTSDDPSSVYAEAGLWREAAVEAERLLTQGRGDRTILLTRLADAYEALGEYEAAQNATLQLVAENDHPGWHTRLRRLEDLALRRTEEE